MREPERDPRRADREDAVVVVGLGGSLAERSTSLAALRIALAGAAESGARTDLLDLRALDLPMFAPGAPPTPPVDRLCETVAGADGLIWASPLYQGTISGSFKNALDWLQLLGRRTPPYLTDKVVGLISTAGGTQGLQAVNTMEFSVRALRGWAVPLVIPISKSWQAFDDTGNLREEEIGEHLRALGREVARAARQFRSRPLTTPEAEQAEKDLQPLR